MARFLMCGESAVLGAEAFYSGVFFHDLKCVRETVLGKGVLDCAPCTFSGGFCAGEHRYLSSLNCSSPILVFDESKG